MLAGGRELGVEVGFSGFGTFFFFAFGGLIPPPR